MDFKAIMPEKFNGDGDWEEWIFQFEQLCEMNEWDERKKCLALGVCLTGRALTLYREIDQATRKDFEAVCNHLQSRFRPPETVQLDKLTFSGRKRKQDENLADLAADLRVLAGRAYPKLTGDAREELLLDKFLTELGDDIRVFVRQSRPETLDAAVSVALQMEAIHAIEKKNKNKNKN